MDASIPIADSLLSWYDKHARDLPWRVPPGGGVADPYRVWLSEIMLQQTTVAAVRPYFAKFISRWPDVGALAAADEQEVMAAWAGLGYYSRARNLIKCARLVAAAGGFPASEAELKKLPGIGDYTAAAIAAIAFGQRAVVVDANVERVVARLFALDEPLPRARKQIRAQADSVTPVERTGDFAQAMMDLGSAVCTVHAPNCVTCPIAYACQGWSQGDPVRYPVKPTKKSRPERLGTAYWIERNRAVWLVQRPPIGMLAGMRSLPDNGWSARADGAGARPMAGDWRALGMVRHSFTHANLTLSVEAITTDSADPPGKGEWWPIDGLEAAGLPSLFAKAARLALA